MHNEIAKLVEVLEATFREVEERRAKERLASLQSEVVFVRPVKIRDLVYQRLELYKDHEARRFAKSFSTKADKVDRYVDSIAFMVCKFFKEFDLYRKPVPRSLVELLIEHYLEVVRTYRRIHTVTKTFSKKRVRKASLDLTVDQVVQLLRLERLQLFRLGRESLGLKAQGRELRPLGQTKAPMVIE